MDEDAKIILTLGTVVLIGIFGSISYNAYINSVVAKDAIKAGLVQKIEQHKRVWVRP